MENTNEIKRISHREYCEARNEMQKKLDLYAEQVVKTKGHYRLVEIYCEYGCGHPIVTKVNWSAIGAVEPIEAVKFANLLMYAAGLANEFKYNGYKVYYEDDDDSL